LVWDGADRSDQFVLSFWILGRSLLLRANRTFALVGLKLACRFQKRGHRFGFFGALRCAARGPHSTPSPCSVAQGRLQREEESLPNIFRRLPLPQCTKSRANGAPVRPRLQLMTVPCDCPTGLTLCGLFLSEDPLISSRHSMHV
jgi:hypothetical protein